MKHYSIRVAGKVQGVSFRATAQRVATELGLTGFARNEPDGSVYLEVEGEEGALQKFLAWCREGSRYAVVDNITQEESEPRKHQGFEIR